MSVLINNDKKELIVTCGCSCDDAVHIKIDKDDYDYYTFVTFMNGNFIEIKVIKKFIELLRKKLKKDLGNY